MKPVKKTPAKNEQRKNIKKNSSQHLVVKQSELKIRKLENIF